MVNDFDHDEKNELFLHLDNATFTVVFDELLKYGVGSNLILINYKNKQIVLSDFIE